MGHFWWLSQILTKRGQIKGKKGKTSERRETKARGRTHLNNRNGKSETTRKRNNSIGTKIENLGRIPTKEKWEGGRTY